MTDRLPPNTCPRRMEAFAYGHDVRGEDRTRPDGTCPYCGSITEDAFLAACERGDELGPTDKNYKVYVDLPEPKPEEMRVVSVISFDPEPERIERERWIRVTDENREQLRRDGWSGSANDRWMQLAPRGPIQHAKFYFQHLAESGRHKFIELLNAGRLKVGYPGVFAVGGWTSERAVAQFLALYLVLQLNSNQEEARALIQTLMQREPQGGKPS